jgi:hypothetical protein
MDTKPPRHPRPMKRSAASDNTARPHAILRCYPRAWRERYGDELADLIAREPHSPRLALDLALGALDAHLHPQIDATGPSRVRRAIGVALLAGMLVAAGYVGQHPVTARTLSAVVAARPAAAIVATATPAEHGYEQGGIRQE